jgi:hypothetical protein
MSLCASPDALIDRLIAGIEACMPGALLNGDRRLNRSVNRR